MTRTTLRRHPVLRRGMISLLVVLLVAGATAVARGATGSPGSSYRVSSAQQGSVAQTLTASGTVDPSKRADVSFAGNGTVRTVALAAGDSVSRGQTIATLERARLEAAVAAATADLAKARAQLESDQAAQADTVSASAATDAGASTTSTSTTQARLARRQRAVRDAQTTTSQALAAARTVLGAQSSVCSGAFQSVSSSEQNSACTAALAAVLDAQSTVEGAQVELQRAMDELAETLRTASADTTSSAPVADGDDSTVSARTIASGQASVDAAKAAVLRAREELDHTRLLAPIAGTVASVGVEPGQQVSAGDVALVIVGAGSVRIETTVSESRVRQVEVGQTASVTGTGAVDSLSGTVTSVGLVPDTSSGSARYPVTVTVPGGAVSLPAGSGATVAIEIATADDVLTVPSSAVSRRGGSATVVAIEHGQTVTKRVQTGVVGALRTEITAGLREGATVVLADLSQPLPTGDNLPGSGLDEFVSRDGFGGPPAGGPGTVRTG